MEKITIKIDRDTYKKLQHIKISTDQETIADAISEMVKLYGDQFIEKKLIENLRLN